MAITLVERLPRQCASGVPAELAPSHSPRSAKNPDAPQQGLNRSSKLPLRRGRHQRVPGRSTWLAARRGFGCPVGIQLLPDRGGDAAGGAAHAPGDSIDQGTELLVGTIERSEAGHGVRVIEVPRILGQTDEVPDGRVGGPGATKRRSRQLRRNALAQECRDVGSAVIESIGGKLERSSSSAAGLSAVDRRSRFRGGDRLCRWRRVRDILRLALATRPASQKLVVAHSCPPSW